MAEDTENVSTDENSTSSSSSKISWLTILKAIATGLITVLTALGVTG